MNAAWVLRARGSWPCQGGPGRCMPQVGLEWFQRQKPHLPAVNGRGQPEPASVLDGELRLALWQQPMRHSVSLKQPPHSGMLAWL